MSSSTSTAPLQIHLNTLLPTLSPLPESLLDLSASLLAQSRLRASTLKPEEEIARAFACCHIACERLGKKLALELEEGNVRPPCPPRVYARLKAFLGSVLRTPAGTVAGGETPRTPRGRREKQGLRGGDEDVTPTKRFAEEVGGRTLRRRTGSRTPLKGVAAMQDEGHEGSADVTTIKQSDEPMLEATDQDKDDDETVLRYRKQPAKTPLRRKEKHAKRDVLDDEEPGPAGLLPGLGTMFQPAVDWLSEERTERYKLWEMEIRRRLDAARQHTAAV